MTIQNYRASVRTNKRAAIVDAAFATFASHGFSGAGMAEIARQADVSTATLYKHFESKEELFSEIAIQHIAPFHAETLEQMDELQVPDDPVKALVDLSGAFVALLRDEQTLQLFRLIIAEGERFPELKEVIYRHGRDPFKQQVTQLLVALRDRGVLHIAEPSAAAEFYIGMLSYWLLFAPIFNPDMRFSGDQLEHIVRENALMFLSRFDADAGTVIDQRDQGASLRNGTPPKLTPSLDDLGSTILA